MADRVRNPDTARTPTAEPVRNRNEFAERIDMETFAPALSAGVSASDRLGAPDGLNLLNNGDLATFELDGFTVTVLSGTLDDSGVSTTQTTGDGAASLFLTHTTGGGTLEATVESDQQECVPGMAYEAMVDVYNEFAANHTHVNQLQIRFYDSGGSQIDTDVSNNTVASANEWAQMYVTDVAPDDAVTMALHAYIEIGQPVTTYLANLTLREAPAMFGYTRSAPPGQGSAGVEIAKNIRFFSGHPNEKAFVPGRMGAALIQNSLDTDDDQLILSLDAAQMTGGTANPFLWVVSKSKSGTYPSRVVMGGPTNAYFEVQKPLYVFDAADVHGVFTPYNGITNMLEAEGSGPADHTMGSTGVFEDAGSFNPAVSVTGGTDVGILVIVTGYFVSLATGQEMRARVDVTWDGGSTYTQGKEVRGYCGASAGSGIMVPFTVCVTSRTSSPGFGPQCRMNARLGGGTAANYALNGMAYYALLTP